MEGKEVRFGIAGERHVRRGDHRHVDGLGELLARLIHTVRRRRAAREHHAVRGHPRRRRRGPVRHARPRAPGGVHRRADGGSDARVPRQEGGAPGDEARSPSTSCSCRASILGSTGAALLIPSARASILNAGAHGLSEVLYAFTSGSNNNGSAFGGLSANTHVLQHVDRHRDAARALRADRVRARRSPDRSAKKKHVPASPGRSRRTPCCSAGCWSGVILIVTALTYFPALSLGPIAEGLLT